MLISHMPHGSRAVAASLPCLGLRAGVHLIVLIVQHVAPHDSYPIGRATCAQEDGVVTTQSSLGCPWPEVPM